MDNSFELPVHYNGKDYLFPGMLVTYGYSYKITMDVFGTVIHFEPDEEGCYRAVIKQEDLIGTAPMDTNLLQLIAETLREVLS